LERKGNKVKLVCRVLTETREQPVFRDKLARVLKELQVYRVHKEIKE